MALGHKPRRLLAALISLTVLLTVAGTAARAKKPGAGSAKQSRIARWRHQPNPAGFRARIPALLKADTAKEQRQAYRNLLRAAIRDASGIERLASDHGGEDDFSITVPAGDLTGDGKDDAVDIFETKLQAVRGTNGNTLWSRPFQGWGGYLGSGRLDARPGDDILALEVLEADLTVGWRWTVNLVALSGDTGSTLWTRTYENVWTLGTVGTTDFYADVDFTLPWGRGEISGDTAPDQLMARIDAAAVASNVLEHFSVATTFESISGANGQPIASYPATGQGGGIPDAVIVPTFTGDAGADVVTTSVTRDGSFRDVDFAAFPGKGGAPTWRRSQAFESQPELLGLRLNADTLGDVLIVDSSEFATVTAVNGSNGSELWQKFTGFDSYPWVVPAGDANGDGGQELLVIADAPYGPGFGLPLGASVAAARNTVTKVAKLGKGGKASKATKATRGALKVPRLPGHELTSTTIGSCYGYGYGYGYGYCGPWIPSPCDGGYGYGYGYTYGSPSLSDYGYGYGGGGCPAFQAALLRGNNGNALWNDSSYGWAEPADDATGDGVVDLLIDGYVVDEDAQKYVPMESVSSGRDGEAAWQRSPVPGEYLISVGGDLNGDGSDDLIGLHFGWEDSYRALSGATGEGLWSETANTGGWLFTLAPTRLDGQGGDLLETVYDFRHDSTDGVGRNGGNGAELWRR